MAETPDPPSSSLPQVTLRPPRRAPPSPSVGLLLLASGVRRLEGQTLGDPGPLLRPRPQRVRRALGGMGAGKPTKRPKGNNARVRPWLCSGMPRT